MQAIAVARLDALRIRMKQVIVVNVTADSWSTTLAMVARMQQMLALTKMMGSVMPVRTALKERTSLTVGLVVLRVHT
eukprot:COSAG05_NODE_7498_length_804_cov_1.175887_2_plen_77_part_00